VKPAEIIVKNKYYMQVGYSVLCQAKNYWWCHKRSVEYDFFTENKTCLWFLQK